MNSMSLKQGCILNALKLVILDVTSVVEM